jgi:hypothetical protein
MDNDIEILSESEYKDKTIKPIEIDKFDIEILYVLFVNDKTTPLESFKIKEIIQNTDSDLSYYTYVTRVQKKMMSLNYIKEGYKDGNAKCFYITDFGIKYLKDNILNTENIYGEENDNE